jgi:hypothetical protein
LRYDAERSYVIARRSARSSPWPAALLPLRLRERLRPRRLPTEHLDLDGDPLPLRFEVEDRLEPGGEGVPFGGRPVALLGERGALTPEPLQPEGEGEEGAGQQEDGGPQREGDGGEHLQVHRCGWGG